MKQGLNPLGRIVLAAALVAAVIGAAATAYADEDWRGGDHDWHDQDHHDWRAQYYYYYQPGYYAYPPPPPVVYAPPAPVYAPPVAPSLNLFFNIR